jgi:putative redox protein
MKATARRRGPTGLTHRVEVRSHELTVDEPVEQGGEDQGPTPQELFAASLASCTAITIEMYVQRKGWDIGEIEVEAEYEAPERGSSAEFTLTLRLPSTLTPQQQQRIRAIAAKCPVHRTLHGETRFHERLELFDP